jgi:two-component system response regulator FixJ
MRLAFAPARLPASDARHRPEPGGKAEAAKIVSIVADDDSQGAFTTGLLERAGYRVVPFRTGEALLAAGPAAVHGCVLLDLRMPGADGLEVLGALAATEAMPPVVMLSDHGGIEEAVTAMKLGAADYLKRPCRPETLLEAIGHALDGHARRKATAIDREAAAKVASLSQRQRQVLQGIVKGQPNKIVAFEIGLSIRTVEAYRAELLRKLDVRGTAEAVRLAVAAGLG